MNIDENDIYKSYIEQDDEALDKASETKNRASEYAKYLGRLGGLARANKLSKIERIEIARKAGKARWGKPKEKMEVKLV